MKATITLFIVLLALSACNNNTDKAPELTVNKPADLPAPITTCYRYTANRDTIELTVTPTGDSIVGTLAYRLWEKDRNSGAFIGRMKGDLLIAEYTFQSEGGTSTRQVAFKKGTQSFEEGYGDVNATNDRVAFKNLDSLTFKGDIKLQEVSCQ